jgi:hypothetical protein
MATARRKPVVFTRTNATISTFARTPQATNSGTSGLNGSRQALGVPTVATVYRGARKPV